MESNVPIFSIGGPHHDNIFISSYWNHLPQTVNVGVWSSLDHDITASFIASGNSTVMESRRWHKISILITQVSPVARYNVCESVCARRFYGRHYVMKLTLKLIPWLLLWPHRKYTASFSFFYQVLKGFAKGKKMSDWCNIMTLKLTTFTFATAQNITLLNFLRPV